MEYVRWYGRGVNVILYKRADMNYLKSLSMNNGIDYLLRKGYVIDKIEESENKNPLYVNEYFRLRNNKGFTISYISLDIKYVCNKLSEYEFTELIDF